MSVSMEYISSYFFSVLIFSAAASELVFRRRAVGVRVSETAAKATGEECLLSDAAIADLGEAENRLIRRYFEITRSDTNANSTPEPPDPRRIFQRQRA